MIRVLSVMGVDNGWGLANRARSLAAAMGEGFEVDVVSTNKLNEVSNEYDIIHAQSLVLVPHLRTHGFLPPYGVWGFEVVSERSLSHVKDLPAGILKSARFCVIKNAALGRRMLHHISRPPTYIPNGVDTDIFKPAAIRVGWCGNKTIGGMEYKGVPLIEQAVAKLNEEWSGLAKAEFIADPGDYPRMVLPHSELCKWYQTLDVFVSASKAEGCSNVVMEALASGVPVVSTNTGIAGELAQKCDLRIVERTADGIADGIRHFCEPIAWRRKAMLNYRWKEVAKPYAKLFREVVR